MGVCPFSIKVHHVLSYHLVEGIAKAGPLPALACGDRHDGLEGLGKEAVLENLLGIRTSFIAKAASKSRQTAIVTTESVPAERGDGTFSSDPQIRSREKCRDPR
jgi:hypothetical protein